ncbi:MAG TPA: hypothetical protein PLD02_09050, partial [Saprospiraceae bacterium]|nr:hypothetical protein [Saprospiraceae bacterium]
MSRYLPLLIAATVLFLIDLYAFQAIRHSVENASVTLKRAISFFYWFISAFTVSSIFLFAFYSPFDFPQAVRVVWFGALIILYLPKILLLPFLVIDDSGRFVRWAAARIFPPATPLGGTRITRSDFIIQAGVLISGLFMSGLIYGVFRGGYNYTVRRISLKLPHLPDA